MTERKFWLGYAIVGLAFGVCTLKRRERFGGGKGNGPLWLLMSAFIWPMFLAAPAINAAGDWHERTMQRRRSGEARWCDWIYFWDKERER